MLDVDDGEHFILLQQALSAVGASPGAAAAHGMLCGMLVVDAGQPMPPWVAWVLDGTEPRGEPARQVLASLATLYDSTRRRLAADDDRFTPLLPDDEQPFAERSRALAEWCDGFLFGLAAEGSDRLASLDADATEALESLVAIAGLQTPPSGPQAVPAAEDDEADLVELVEFVRVAVFLLRHQRDDQRGQHHAS